MSTESMALVSQGYDMASFEDDVLNSQFVDVDTFFPQPVQSASTSEPSESLISKLENSLPLQFSSSVSESSGTPPRSSRSSRASSVDEEFQRVPSLDSGAIQHLLEEQNLKKQRLARKAELARITRKRKKERLGELEVEVKRLKAEIECLRKRNAEILENARSGKEVLVDENVVEEQKCIQKSLEKIVVASSSNGQASSEQVLPNLVTELMEVFSKRSLTSKSHLYSLEASLSPCMPLRFLNWAMCQDDKFYQDPQGLWNCLFKQQLGLTDEQMLQILSLRVEMKKQRDLGLKVEEIYRKFRPLVEMHLAQTGSNLDRLRIILSSEQLAKFFVWVEQNQLCVKMLESVAP